MRLRVGRRPWNEVLFRLANGTSDDDVEAREGTDVLGGGSSAGNDEARQIMLTAIADLDIDLTTFATNADAVASLLSMRSAFVRVGGACGAGRPPVLTTETSEADSIDPI